MVQCYGIFWLMTSIASLKMVMDRLGSAEDDEAQKEQRDELEAMGKMFSGEFISRMFIMIGALLLVFDCVGLFLAYQYVEFRPWQLAVFYISIAALTGDLAHNIYRYRGLRAEGADVSAILTESIDDLTSGWNILTLIAIGGKLILGVLLVLWTVFPY
ncbi:hypothetical protein SAMN02910323_0485 [Selenomonas ruminantium]|jgi:hypothetical protein|uniref:Uncharacterized protein n=2 Tax=Selenomonas ruminantium TaxID=971 RepID=A0A1K1M014_SELRU|nr:hypothetical protein SAMN02910323_0485 [Selenomonas ruminantium]